MKTPGRLAIGVVLGAILFCGSFGTAFGQGDIFQRNISSLEFSNTDVHEAIRTLFKQVNVPYSIDPDVHGKITLSLKQATFEIALQNILRQVDCTIRAEGGVIQIIKRHDTLVQKKSDSERPVMIVDSYMRRIKFLHADPTFIARMLGAPKGSQDYQFDPELTTIVLGGSANDMLGGGAGRFGGAPGFGSGRRGGFSG